ncbi:Ldh family oxidoreductase [Acaryochloris marina]|uniref:Malate dehydrogenase, putative n=1 Tax=Acaryochloris marina (strain MBIC 11017) TaxID=329726 RepID=B0C6P9_ACAM1|nr:Ldh family oxidoreductase [Acaryochloris marina]ABW27605.1 malate dehydrogenase, putative [Acaryochloris marina MBIC11017]BDM82339.1 lactate dehydrogenase [Acaryochloris marina MBIC10699]
MNPLIQVSAAQLRAFLTAVLANYPLQSEAATAITDHLVQANLWGMDSHGLQQIMGYDKSLRSGRINPQPKLHIQTDRPTMIRIEADRAPGQYAGQIAMQQAITKAQEMGMAVVGVTNSNHFGMAGYYTRMAAAAGMIGFATSDTNVVDLAPYGGKEARLGNNPFSWGIPNGDMPIVLDMAAGTVSGGKIKHFGYQGLPIPPEWGLTAAGETTSEAQAVAVNQAASPKGAGMALVADLLCGPLLGTAAALFKTKSRHDRMNGTGHFFWVMDLAVWSDPEEFAERVGDAIATLKQTPRLDPQQPIYFPGELEVVTEQTRIHQGIPVPYALIQDLARHFGPDLVNQHLTPDLSISINA